MRFKIKRLHLIICVLILGGFYLSFSPKVLLAVNFADSSTNKNENTTPKISKEINNKEPNPNIQNNTFSEHKEEQKEFLPYSPPLSFHQSAILLKKVQNRISDKKGELIIDEIEHLIEIIKSVENYLGVIEEKYSNIDEYSWYYIGKHRVGKRPVDKDHYVVRPPLKNVQVISFEAQQEDVFLIDVEVITELEKSIKFKMEKVIYSRYPRREMCKLFFPVTVSEITLRYYPCGEKSAIMQVYCGISEKPNRISETLYYLQTAKNSMQSRDWEDASLNLEKAFKILIRFR